MNVLITGIAGHLGSRFAAWLRQHVPTAQIVGVDNFSCGYRENVPAGVTLIEEDLLAAVALPPADYIFHFAAYAAECLSPFIRRYNVRQNWEATAVVINHALASGCRRLVYTSSMSVYGRGLSPFDEEDQTEPIDPYGVAKLAGERDLAIAGDQHGLDWCILRPHNLYGPGQSIWQKYRNVLGLWMRAALEGRPLRIYGDGRQQRAFSFLDDCLPCLWAAAVEPRASRQVINLGGQQPIAIATAAELVSKITGQGEIVHLEPRHEVQRAFCTVERSQQLLGFVDRTSLWQGLQAMWEWAQRAWQDHPQRRCLADPFVLELDRGLYSYWRAR